MKVISIDNFDREIIGQSDDELIAENVSDYWAEQIATLLNDKFGGDSAPRFYKAVSDDYTLREYRP